MANRPRREVTLSAPDADRDTSEGSPVPVADGRIVDSPEKAPAQIQVPKLDGVLQQSRDIKVKVEACADDLGVINSIVKKEITAGAITETTHRAIAESESIEDKVQACADDLDDVNAKLASGVSDLKQAQAALTGYKSALAHAEVALEKSRRAERAAQIQSLHDQKTGLPNRALFDDRLTKAIASVDRDGGTLAVMFFDLDRFKSINDQHGHAVGDQVLKEVSLRISAHCREKDTLCRNGGDEFLYLLINPGESENIERIVEGVLSKVAAPIEIDAKQVVITTSVGISIYPDDGENADVLVHKADQAMYEAKRDSRRFSFYSDRRVNARS